MSKKINSLKFGQYFDNTNSKMSNNLIMNPMMNNNMNNNMNPMMNNYMNQNMNLNNYIIMNENQMNSKNQLLNYMNMKNIKTEIMKNILNNKNNDNDEELIEKKNIKLAIKEKLKYFLSFISINNEISENEENENLKGSEISINYYNIVEFSVYLDLDLKINELIPYIFWKIFYSNKCKLEFKRFQKNETTEYIIKNPKKIPDFNFFIGYSNFLFLEYKDKPLSMFKDKTGSEIGLKENDELLLKLNNDFYDDLYKEHDICVICKFSTKGKNFNRNFIWCNNISRRLNQIFVNCIKLLNGKELKDTDIIITNSI